MDHYITTGNDSVIPLPNPKAKWQMAYNFYELLTKQHIYKQIWGLFTGIQEFQSTFHQSNIHGIQLHAYTGPMPHDIT